MPRTWPKRLLCIVGALLLLVELAVRVKYASEHHDLVYLITPLHTVRPFSRILQKRPATIVSPESAQHMVRDGDWFRIDVPVGEHTITYEMAADPFAPIQSRVQGRPKHYNLTRHYLLLQDTPNCGVDTSIVSEYTKEAIEIRFNTLCGRGPDPRPDTDDMLTLAIVGDGSVSQYHLPEEQTWVRQLETLLNAGGQQAQVVNLGYPGQHLKSLGADAMRERLMWLRPDYILVYTGRIDSGLARRGFYMADTFITKRFGQWPLHPYLHYRWMTYTYLVEKYAFWVRTHRPERLAEDVPLTPNVEAAVALMQSYGSRLIWVPLVLPQTQSADAGNTFKLLAKKRAAALQDRILEHGRANDIPVWDVRSALAGDASLFWGTRLTERGSERLAAELAHRINELVARSAQLP